jgi:hypothetical protein
MVLSLPEPLMPWFMLDLLAEIYDFVSLIELLTYIADLMEHSGSKLCQYKWKLLIYLMALYSQR